MEVSCGRGWWSKSLIADFAYNAYVSGLKEIPLSTRVPKQVWSELEQFMREERLDKSAAEEAALDRTGRLETEEGSGDTSGRKGNLHEGC